MMHGNYQYLLYYTSLSSPISTPSSTTDNKDNNNNNRNKNSEEVSNNHDPNYYNQLPVEVFERCFVLLLRYIHRDVKNNISACSII